MKGRQLYQLLELLPPSTMQVDRRDGYQYINIDIILYDDNAIAADTIFSNSIFCVIALLAINIDTLLPSLGTHLPISVRCLVHPSVGCH